MKKINLLLIGILLSAQFMASGQAPGLFNYQAVIRADTGILANTAVALVLKLYNNGVGNPPVLYQESFSANTNANGIVNLVVGNSPSLGNLSNLNWSVGPYYIDIDLNGTSIYGGGNLAQLVSVPYALYANKADSATWALGAPQTKYRPGSGISISNDTIYNTAPAIDFTPVGTIVAFGGLTPPTGWALCDGSSEPTSGAYAALYAVIGTGYGGNGTTNFTLPDFRGQFLRGAQMNLSPAQGGDPDVSSRTVNGTNATTAPGSWQLDTLKSHTHVVEGTELGMATGSSNFWMLCGNTPTPSCSPTTAIGGTETRPKNVYVNYIIKY